MAYNRVDNILQEADNEYSNPSYMDYYAKIGIFKDLKNVDAQNELLKDIMLEQKETM